MKWLVGWDKEAEAELLSLYLNLEDTQTLVTTDRQELLRLAREQLWDLVLFAVSPSDPDGSFELFLELRQAQPECPIVGACHPSEMFRLARFMTHGMRSYLLRDDGGDFLFLIRSALHGVVEAVQAERERVVAERLREEIESVRKLQESIIPHDLQCPEGYQVAARYEPSQIEVVGGRPVVLAGGDYYDVFRLDENHLVLLVGDASGHGMKACMAIFTMHTLVRMIRGQKYQDTAEFVSEINRRLCEQNILRDEGGFITLLYGILDSDRHSFEWTAAGHPLPLLFNKRNGHVHTIGDPRDQVGLPLGLFSEAEYQSHRLELPESSRLVIYTDGLVEAFPEAPRHNEYGIKGVVCTLRRTAEQTLSACLDALFQDSYAHTQGAGRHDDTSVVLLERI